MKNSKLKQIEKDARKLMEYVIEKYNITCLEDFTCEHHRTLASSLDMFFTPSKSKHDEEK